MSGSNNGPFDYGTSESCEFLSIKTQVASPDPAVLRKISTTTILNVVLQNPTGPVELHTKDKEVVGAVIPSEIAKLIQCISDGYSYKAKVLKITGGNCEILITHQ
ncbi:MAG: hypothetical protein ACP5N7_04830 [Candidatus Pacearchaeota archaeon]